MKTRIMPCVCIDHEPNSGDSLYYGMPQFKVTDNMDYWEIYCPNCGRGGLLQFKSPYLAVKDWNDMQERLRMVKDGSFIFAEEGEENEG